MSNKYDMKKTVRQHNDYVAAPYAVELTSHEIKLFEYMIADSKDLDRNLIKDNQNKEFQFSATELSKILNTSLSRIVADADKLAENITTKRIIEKKYNIKGEVEDFVYIPIITFAKYHKGLFTFAFNCYILRYFVDINKNFTEFQLPYLMSMSSSYSIKLYKLLYQYKNIKKRLFTVIELKEQFGVSNKYSQYSDFKKYVIQPSVKQINNLTDLMVDVKEYKIGRSVNKLEFTFKLKNLLNNIITINDEKDTKEQSFNGYLEIEDRISVKTKSLIKLCEKEKSKEYVSESIKYALKYSKTNFDKYLSDTLTNGWADLEIKNKKEKKELLKSTAIKVNNDVSKKEKEKENLAKSEIEHEWSKLSNLEKQKYTNYSDFIISKYSIKLTAFPSLEKNLPYSVYAVSKSKFYNRILESYIENALNVSLNINKSVKKY